MYSAVSSGPLLRKLHASSSERTASHAVSTIRQSSWEVHTLQPVDCPCLELFQCNLCGGWQRVEVEPVFIVLLLKFCFRKLSLLGINLRASLGVDSGVIVADHGVGVFLRCLAACTSPRLMMVLKWQARSRARVKHASHI